MNALLSPILTARNETGGTLLDFSCLSFFLFFFLFLSDTHKLFPDDFFSFLLFLSLISFFSSCWKERGLAGWVFFLLVRGG